MPSIEQNHGMRLIRAGLLHFDVRFSEVGFWAGHAALAILILSGESLPWLNLVDWHYSIPLMRGIHVLAGLTLLLVFTARLGGLILRGMRFAALQRGVHRAVLPFIMVKIKSGRNLMFLAYWSVTGLILLSGLERLFQVRYGVMLLPWLTPAQWAVLHHQLKPYLYVILLYLFITQGKIIVKRMMNYLYAP